MNTLFMYSKLRYRDKILHCERIYRFYDAIIVFITWNATISFGKEYLHFFLKDYIKAMENLLPSLFCQHIGKVKIR